MEAKSAREPCARNLKKVMLAVIILMYNVTFPPTMVTFCIFTPNAALQVYSLYFLYLGRYGFLLSGKGIVRGMPLWGMDLNECIWLTSNLPIK